MGFDAGNLRRPAPSYPADSEHQGLTLVHFAAQLEPFLTQKHTLVFSL
jgi:hypothetical protein